MNPTDRESKTRFLLLLGAPVLLFGGFALWGITDRARQNTPENWLESPARVSAERAETLARQREAFALRKQVSLLGKQKRWKDAASLITDGFLARNNFRNLRFVRGEAWLRAGDERGAVVLRDNLQTDKSLNPHEADLFAGSDSACRTATAQAVRDADATRITALDANNLAWRVCLAPRITDAAGMRKTVALSEYAVATARKQGDSELLATFTNTMGGVYVRAGRGKDAVRTLTESEHLRPDPFNAALLALAYRNLGDAKAATRERDKLQKYLNNTFATRDGQINRHQLLLFWRETQELGTVTAN